VIVVLTSSEQFFQLYNDETSYITMRWRCLLCTWSTHLVGFLIMQAHWNNSPHVDI